MDISADKAGPGDVVIVNGTIGEHGIAIISSREKFDFNVPFISDTAALNKIVKRLATEIPEIHTMHDATRGGTCHHL